MPCREIRFAQLKTKLQRLLLSYFLATIEVKIDSKPAPSEIESNPVQSTAKRPTLPVPR